MVVPFFGVVTPFSALLGVVIPVSALIGVVTPSMAPPWGSFFGVTTPAAVLEK